MEPCPFTQKLAGIAERGEQAAADVLHDHIQTCGSCKAEVLRLNAVMQEEPGGLQELGKNILVGLGVFAAVGIVLGFRGVAEAIRDSSKK